MYACVRGVRVRVRVSVSVHVRVRVRVCRYQELLEPSFGACDGEPSMGQLGFRRVEYILMSEFFRSKYSCSGNGDGEQRHLWNQQYHTRYDPQGGIIPARVFGLPRRTIMREQPHRCGGAPSTPLGLSCRRKTRQGSR